MFNTWLLHLTIACLISTTIYFYSVKLISNKYFVIICNSSYNEAVCVSIQLYILIFKCSHLCSTVDIFFQQSVIYRSWWMVHKISPSYYRKLFDTVKVEKYPWEGGKANDRDDFKGEGRTATGWLNKKVGSREYSSRGPCAKLARLYIM